jgi:hypothetical protein
MTEPTVAAVLRTCPHLSKSVHRTEQNRGEQNRSGVGLSNRNSDLDKSPDPSVLGEVWHHLTAGLAWLSENDHGRPWPNPDRRALRALTAEFDPDLCIRAACEAREIVIAQDRAPNITNLFAKKLAELAEVRSTVRSSLEGASCL